MNPLVSNFPFSAVAGQEHFKLALLLLAVNPRIGGVLVSGPRGCGKSTLAKGLSDILPKQGNAHHPFITLPLGASEEMLIGTLNLQQVLHEQKVEFQPGLLAKADNGILYVDEVNLLPDNLVDQLLDVATSGVNFIERDGVSHQHKARFVLLGTMNPDEGELRPQLIDRFGLSVELSNQFTLEERMDIVRLREQFDKGPELFQKKKRQNQLDLSAKIENAQAIIDTVVCSETARRLIAERCSEAKVDGMRADIVWVQSAIARAALNERVDVTTEDVLAVEELVLNHRRNHTPPPSNSRNNTPSKPFSRPDNKPENTGEGDWGAMEAVEQTTQDIAQIKFNLNGLATYHPNSAFDFVRNNRKGSARGHNITSVGGTKINWFRTLISNYGHWPVDKIIFNPDRQAENVIHSVVLDTSGSILSNNSFAKAKGLILQVAKQAYLAREQFEIIGFGNQKVEKLLTLRRAPKAIRQLLDSIKASGGTPLLEAMNEILRLQEQYIQKLPSIKFKTYVITDGRISTEIKNQPIRGDVVIVDVEQSQVKRGKGRQIAEKLNAEYYPLFA